ncbi:MAG: aromatic amino acid transport family protein [Chlamydiota bacterium]|jgi:tyrosine-specific transport protein
MSQKPGSILGGMFLTAGSCIGAGMLGLPILSGMAGFFPAILMTLLAWVFMTFTALLLVEVNGWFKGQVNIVTISEKAFGPKGKVVSWVLYLFLFYSLLIAYIAGSGSVFSAFLQKAFHIDFSPSIIGFVFVLSLGFIVYLGTKLVDMTNRFLMIALIIAYAGMMFLGVQKIDANLLQYHNWSYLILPLPILVTSFGFHNMIPSLTAYMNGDLKRMRITIMGGSLISLIIYTFWQVMILGIVPVFGENSISNVFSLGGEITKPLIHYLHSPWIIIFTQVFAFFAIITSFLAQSLSVMHFIADGLKVKPIKKNNRWLILLALIPPYLFALTYPGVFLKALSFAGGFCAVILFGILPALMAWVGRYSRKYSSQYHVMGGKISLIIAILFSSFLVLNELGRILGINIFINY